ncbi:MAG: hypothetical protein E6182_18230 [Clostridioides difficile]|nr:hypothetical protein [Clostridioides difficile]
MADISMKFKKVVAIREAMVKQIDNCQEIKKLLKYHTNTPLSKYGFLKNGKKIEQVDVNESLIDVNIIPSLFDENLLNKDKVIIFVFPHKGDFGGEIGDNYFAIDIICPQNLNKLSEMGEERIFLIAGLIADLFDDKKILKKNGNPLTQYKANFTNFEVSRTDKNLECIGVSMTVNVPTVNARTYKNR